MENTNITFYALTALLCFYVVVAAWRSRAVGTYAKRINEPAGHCVP
jgi:hypothetical protein